jgi:hypothetical protein
MTRVGDDRTTTAGQAGDEPGEQVGDALLSLGESGGRVGTEHATNEMFE